MSGSTHSGHWHTAGTDASLGRLGAHNRCIAGTPCCQLSTAEGVALAVLEVAGAWSGGGGGGGEIGREHV